MNLYQIVLNQLPPPPPQPTSNYFLSITKGTKYHKQAKLNRTPECTKWITEDFQKSSNFIIIHKTKLIKIITEHAPHFPRDSIDLIQSDKVLISASGEICEANPVTINTTYLVNHSIVHPLEQYAYDSYVTKESKIPPMSIKKERIEEQYKAMNELTSYIKKMNKKINKKKLKP